MYCKKKRHQKADSLRFLDRYINMFKGTSGCLAAQLSRLSRFQVESLVFMTFIAHEQQNLTAGLSIFKKKYPRFGKGFFSITFRDQLQVSTLIRVEVMIK